MSRQYSRSHVCRQRSSLAGSPYVHKLHVKVLEDRRMLAVLTVGNTLDDTLANLAGDGELSLREAIVVANTPGTQIDGFTSNDVADTINFAASLSGQTIALGGTQLEITDALIIDATALTESVTINAQQQSRIFLIDDPNTTEEDFHVTLAGLTIVNGKVSGFVFVQGGGIESFTLGNLSLDEVIISGNSVDDFLYARGGGVSARGNLTLTDSEVSGNIATSEATGSAGGGIFVDKRGEITISHSIVSGNMALGNDSDGGGISTGGGGIFANGNVSIYYSSVTNNSATGFAGGVRASGNGIVYLYHSIVGGNQAGASAGGIMATNITLQHSSVDKNSSDRREYGGGQLVGR